MNKNYDRKKLFDVKFIYSEKATNISQNLHLFLTGTSAIQKKVEILQNICGLLRIYELYQRFTWHQSYVLLSIETALSNYPAVIPKSSCDVHLLRSPWIGS